MPDLEADSPAELQLRIDAADHPPVHLEQCGGVEDDAGVALFGIAHDGRRVYRQPRAGFRYEPQLVDGHSCLDEREQVLRVGLVVERVVSGPVAVDADRGRHRVLVDRSPVPAHEHLVPFGAAVGVMRVEQNVVEIVA